MNTRELPGAVEQTRRGFGNFFLWFILFCVSFFCSYSRTQPKWVHPAFSQSFHFSLSLVPSVHLLILLSACPVSCQPPTPTFFHLQENLYQLPHILLPERNKQGLCLCRSGWKKEEEPCRLVGGITAALERGAVRGEQCCSSAGLSVAISAELCRASSSVAGGTAWTGASPVSTGEKIMNLALIKASPYASGWRRLDYVTGKPVCLYFWWD